MKPAPVWQAGYTIIETMIFLIVSGVLLLSVLALFGSRVQRTQFNQAIQSFDSRLKTAANEASTGTYPDAPAFNCTAPNGDPPQITDLAANDQGTRSECIFIGKVVSPAATCTQPLATNECTAIDVSTVVGRRLSASNTVTASLAEAKPVVVNDKPDITQTFNLDYGTRITGIYNKPDKSLLSGVGFFQSFNGSYSAGKLTSGAQSLETWSILSSNIPASPLNPGDMRLAVNSGRLNQTTPGNTVICLRSGGTNQKASITLATSNGVLATTITQEDVLCP